MVKFNGFQFYYDLVQVLQRYRFNYRSRQQLAQLDDNALRDIGISYEEAKHESQRPFWKGSRLVMLNRSGFVSGVSTQNEKIVRLVDSSQSDFSYANHITLNSKTICSIDRKKAG